MLPAARTTDAVACPAHGVTKVQGPGCPTVLIGNQPAAREGDVTSCGEAIIRGCPTVLIGNARAARTSEKVAQGGTVVGGFPRVRIGNPPVDARGNAIPVPPECRYLSRGLAGAPAASLDRLRSPAPMSPPVPGQHRFPGDATPSPSREYEVTVRGHKIKVVESVSGPPDGTWLPTPDMIAAALAVLPDEQLAAVHAVVISPNPSEKYPNAPAECTPDGEIRFFWRKVRHEQSDIDWTILHEAGHTYTHGWAANPGARTEWEEAMRSDGRPPTDLTDGEAAQDFSEAVVMYALSKGTPCEATARAIFPARYQILDRLYPNGFPRRNGPRS
jgi:uncharacterized Zn-binding protein involved in type VI secretion